MPSPESSQETVANLVPQLQLGLLLSKSPAPWPEPFFGSSGAQLVLWVSTSILCSSGILMTVPTNNVHVGIGILTLFFLPLPPFLPFLAAFPAASANSVHIHWI